MQAPLRPVPIRAAADPMPRLLSADSAGQFVVSLDGRVVLGSGPYAGKPLSQVRISDVQLPVQHGARWCAAAGAEGAAAGARHALSACPPRLQSVAPHCVLQ